MEVFLELTEEFDSLKTTQTGKFVVQLRAIVDFRPYRLLKDETRSILTILDADKRVVVLESYEQIKNMIIHATDEISPIVKA